MVSSPIDEETISISSDSSDTHTRMNLGSKKLNQKRNKRRASAISESDENELFEKALAVMNQNNDEWDIFGQYVASEMRQISDPTLRQIAKTEIIKIILSHSNVIVSTPQVQRQNIPITRTIPIVNDNCIQNANIATFSSDDIGDIIQLDHNYVANSIDYIEEYEFE